MMEERALNVNDYAVEAAKAYAKRAAFNLAKRYIAPVTWTIVGVAFALVFVFIMLSFTVGGLAASLDTREGFRSGTPTTIAVAEIGEYMPIFEQAQARYGVSWAVLAAICKIESGFGRNMGPSSAGAVGFMQFMPTTWSGSGNPLASDDPQSPSWDTDPERIARYGGYGVDGDGDGKADPFNPWDAVFAAANYLAKNGFAEDPRRAIFAYNRAWWYVDMVLAQAEEYSQQMVPVENGAWPLPAQFVQITCPYGSPREGGFHRGVDIACPVGTPVFAALPGRVSYAGWNGAYGYCVIIDAGSGTEVLYGHLSQIGVRAGEEVEKNQQIALSGNTGRSTGPHLHFEVRVNGRTCDPMQWLNPPNQNY